MFDCKANFKNKYRENQFLFCELCLVKEDSQSHIFDCFVLKNSVKELRNSPNVKYEHIFEDVEKQIPAIKLMYEIVSVREMIDPAALAISYVRQNFMFCYWINIYTSILELSKL